MPQLSINKQNIFTGERTTTSWRSAPDLSVTDRRAIPCGGCGKALNRQRTETYTAGDPVSRERAEARLSAHLDQLEADGQLCGACAPGPKWAKAPEGRRYSAEIGGISYTITGNKDGSAWLVSAPHLNHLPRSSYEWWNSRTRTKLYEAQEFAEIDGLEREALTPGQLVERDHRAVLHPAVRSALQRLERFRFNDVSSAALEILLAALDAAVGPPEFARGMAGLFNKLAHEARWGER